MGSSEGRVQHRWGIFTDHSAKSGLFRILVAYLLGGILLGLVSFLRFPHRPLPLADLAIVIVVSFGILVPPLLFTLGAWYVRTRIPADSTSARRLRWRALLVYSFILFSVMFVLGLTKPLEIGSFKGWLISLSTMLGYGVYLTFPLAGLTLLVSFVALLIVRDVGQPGK